MLKIAITGNIASGKSQVQKKLASKFNVYDTDEIAHCILDEITDFYGLDVFTNGKIDRKKLGALVFSNKEIKEKLENLVHPKVKEKLNLIFKKEKEEQLVFVAVPLLYETDFYKLFDKTVIVVADDNIRLERLMKRNNFTREEALLRINSQYPQEEKIKRADFVIENNGSIEHLELQVENFQRTIGAVKS